MHSATAKALCTRLQICLPSACRSLAVFLPPSPSSSRRPVPATVSGDDTSSSGTLHPSGSDADDMGAGRPPEFPTLPLSEGQYPKPVLIDYFQAVLRGPPLLRFDVTQMEGPCAGNTFADGRSRFLCTLETPPISTVVGGTKIQIPAMEFEGVAHDKKSAEHEASLAALTALLGGAVYAELLEPEDWRTGRGDMLQRPPDDVLQRVEDIVGHRFKNRNLLRRALWHPSVGPVHNACLALIGDAVLDVCALTQAYEAGPDLAGSTASMNGYRTERCSRASCARVAASLGLHKFLVTGGGYTDAQGGLLPMDSMVAEMLEAVIGAIYEDAGKGGAGLEAAQLFYLRHWPPPPSRVTIADSE